MQTPKIDDSRRSVTPAWCRKMVHRSPGKIVLLIGLFWFLALTGIPELHGQGLGGVPGMDLQASFTGEVWGNLSGGQRRGTVSLGELDVTASVDLNRLWDWPGGNLFLYGLGTLGGSPASLAGDAQGVSNIEAPDAVRLYEAWYEQLFPETGLSALAGLYSLDTEFNVVRTADLFLESSHGTGATLGLSGENGPSIFPYTSPGIRFKWVPRSGIALQLAVLDGVPGMPGRPHGTHIRIRPQDGALLTAEAAYLWLDEAVPEGTHRWLRHQQASRLAEIPFRARFALGAWRYTGTFPDLAARDFQGGPVLRKGSTGFYAQAEGQVFSEPDDPGQGLNLFAQMGVANPRVNRFARYVGGGAVYRGMFPGRDEDRFGLAVAAAFNGAPYLAQAGQADGAEVDLEWTYLAPVTSRLSLQGDVQYVINPDTDPSLANAFMVAVRILIDF